jgi:hypothetical protein
MRVLGDSVFDGESKRVGESSPVVASRAALRSSSDMPPAFAGGRRSSGLGVSGVCPGTRVTRGIGWSCGLQRGTLHKRSILQVSYVDHLQAVRVADTSTRPTYTPPALPFTCHDGMMCAGSARLMDSLLLGDVSYERMTLRKCWKSPVRIDRPVNA